MQTVLACTEPGERSTPDRPGILLRCPGVDEQVTVRGKHSCNLSREPVEIEVVHGVERRDEVDRSVRDREPLSVATHNKAFACPVMLQQGEEHGMAVVDGVEQHSIAEQLGQQFGVATRAGTDIDTDQRSVGETISNLQDRFAIGLAQRCVMRRNASEVPLSQMPLGDVPRFPTRRFTLRTSELCIRAIYSRMSQGGDVRVPPPRRSDGG